MIYKISDLSDNQLKIIKCLFLNSLNIFKLNNDKREKLKMANSKIEESMINKIYDQKLNFCFNLSSQYFSFLIKTGMKLNKNNEFCLFTLNNRKIRSKINDIPNINNANIIEDTVIIEIEETDLINKDIEELKKKEEENKKINKNENNNSIFKNNLDIFKTKKNEENSFNKENQIKKEERKEDNEKFKKNKKKHSFKITQVSENEVDYFNKIKYSKEKYNEENFKNYLEQFNTLKNTLVFNLGSKKIENKNVDINKERSKLESLANTRINTSMDDLNKEMKLVSNLNDFNKTNLKFKIQTETDNIRRIDNIIKNIVNIKVKYTKFEKEYSENLTLHVFPLNIPSSGTSFSEDMCIYLEENDFITHTLSNENKMIKLETDEYIVFVKSSFENGKFITSVKVFSKIENLENNVNIKNIYPKEIDEETGIGHNILYLDYITKVHVLTINKCENNELAEFITLVIKDVGYDGKRITTRKNSVTCDINGDSYKFRIFVKYIDNNINIDVTTPGQKYR